MYPTKTKTRSNDTQSPQSETGEASWMALPEDSKDAVVANLYFENVQLKTQLQDAQEKITKLQAQHETDRGVVADQAADLYEYKMRLAHAQKVIKDFDYAKRTGDLQRVFQYEYNILDFNNAASSASVDYLFDTFRRLVDYQFPDGSYVVNGAMDVTPIYLVVSKDSAFINTQYRYSGSLADFVGSWNVNVAKNIEDVERAKALTCNYESLKADISKSPWKDSSPESWQNLYLSATRKRSALKRAVNILDRLHRACC